MSQSSLPKCQDTPFPTQEEIERLGRQRPEIFTSWWREVGFCFALLTSIGMCEYTISGFNIVLPTLSTELNIPPESNIWPASVYSLVAGAFLLPAGRLSDIYGGYVVFVSGLLWFFIWSLIAGFSQNLVMLNCCRALQGLGPAAFLPSGIMLMGNIYRPGPRKNIVFSLYGACAPLGFFFGIFIAGLSGQYLPWRWFFWISATILLVITVVAFLTVPKKSPPVRKVQMDWWGTATIVPGLILVIFSITDSQASSSWSSPRIYITFSLGIIFLSIAFYIEGWASESPLLPFDMFKVKYMTPLVLALIFGNGVFGLYLFYASFYIENILGATPLQTTVWFAPLAVGGFILATTGGFILHLLPGTILLILSGLGCVISVLLFALIPENPNYWAWIFPAMVCSTINVDVSFSITNIFITTSFPSHRQGLAGALINTIYFLSVSLQLSMASFAVASSAHLGPAKSYKAAFWLGVGCAGLALILLVGFVRIEKAKSDLTADEKAELAGHESASMTGPTSSAER